MSLGAFFGRLEATLLRRHGTVKCFDDEIRAGGGMAGRKDGGLRTVEVSKIIGSVGRAQTLRGDFCYLRGQAMTARFYRVGQAMEEGRALPPLELYKVARAPHAHTSALSEYYVLDGHHRVAMARKLGQEFFDAHVVEYCLAGERSGQAVLKTRLFPSLRSRTRQPPCWRMIASGKV